MRRARSVALAAIVVVAMLVACELALRLRDGYALAALDLRAPPSPAAADAAPNLVDVATRLSADRDVDPAWIDDLPTVPRSEVDRQLLALRARFHRTDVPDATLYNIWNGRRVELDGCSTGGPFQNVFPLLPMPLDVFDPPEPSPHPVARYHPNRTTPQGLTTNRFGFRGPDVPLDKPRDTVRIAFVGASTTLGYPGYPFSYPDCVVHWLNRWAERAGFAVRFDGINAGRAGLGSTDIAAIVRQEVAPLEPDLTLYYEGANQFVFHSPLVTDGPASRWAKGSPPATWERMMATPRRYSALARRVDRLATVVAARGGREPAKPELVLRWPDGVDETAPDVARADLPLTLPVILADLESIRTVVERDGGELALGSFVWLAFDGLRLDPLRHGFVYSFLNARLWPYRYADIRRFADFQNRVFRRYAERHDLLFVDVAGAYPQDPELFIDAIHFNEAGTRLQAWIVLQAILPRVRERVTTGAWPRPDRTPLASHPAFTPPRQVTLPCAQ